MSKKFTFTCNHALCIEPCKLIIEAPANHSELTNQPGYCPLDGETDCNWTKKEDSEND